MRNVGPVSAEELPDDGADGSTTTDVLAPVVVGLYVVLQFEPFATLIQLPGAASSVVFTVLALGVLAVTPRTRLGSAPVSISFVAVAVWSAMSVTWSEDVTWTAALLRNQLLPLILVSVVVSTIPPRRLVNTFLLIVAVVGVWSLTRSVLWTDGRVVDLGDGALQHGFRGSFRHKNLLGVFLVGGLSAALVFCRPPRWGSGVRRVAIVTLVAGTLATRSLTAVSGLVVVVIGWRWIEARRRHRTVRGRRMVAVFAWVTGIVSTFAVVALLPTILGVYDKDLTFSGRTSIWSESVATIADRPILGHGYGGLFTDSVGPVLSDLYGRVGFSFPHAHNGVLGVALDTGLIGVLLVVLFVGQVIGMARTCMREPSLLPYGEWIALTSASLLVMSVVEPLLWGPHLLLYLIPWTAAKRAHRQVTRDESGRVTPTTRRGHRPHGHDGVGSAPVPTPR